MNMKPYTPSQLSTRIFAVYEILMKIDITRKKAKYLQTSRRYRNLLRLRWGYDTTLKNAA
jgi:transposase